MVVLEVEVPVGGLNKAVSRRKPTIHAIPTTYKGVAMRSRLEARWAAFFDLLGWRWEYEPDIQAGYVIPDFLLSFAHPVLIECKPALTVSDLVEYRRSLIGKVSDWLQDDVLREIRELDADPESPVDLTDLALDDLVRVACGNNPLGRSRRVLVVGPRLYVDGAYPSIDGTYGFCLCCNNGEPSHIGLSAEHGTHCLLCGQTSPAWADSNTMLNAWRTSQNEVQWRPG